MTIKTAKTHRNPAVSNDESISDCLPVAIPLGAAIEPEPPIVIYNNSNYGESTDDRTATATEVLNSATGASSHSKLSAFALVSLILGIISIVFPLLGIFFGITAIVFGALAMHRIRLQPNLYHGLCMAHSGIITGMIGTVFWMSIFIAIMTMDPSEDPSEAESQN